MLSKTHQLPLVLAIGGHDPSGGAGIQADLEAVAAQGLHAVSLITCLTEQDSCNVRSLHPVSPDLLARQAALLMEDSRIAAFKIGLLGSADIVEPVVELLAENPDIPVVFDPVLAAGGGSDLAGRDLLEQVRSRLLPRCDLITPNIPEAVRLSGLQGGADPGACARRLLELGARAVLITGTHDPEQAATITHHLYRAGAPTLTSEWPRLKGEYHGSGCTLAAAIAAGMARGEPLDRAVGEALEYTWQSLSQAFRSGRCQLTPDRLFRPGRGQRDE